MQINTSIVAKLKTCTGKEQFFSRNEIYKNMQNFVDTKLRSETGEKNLLTQIQFQEKKCLLFSVYFLIWNLKFWNGFDVTAKLCSLITQFPLCSMALKTIQSKISVYIYIYTHARAQRHCVRLCLLSSSSWLLEYRNGNYCCGKCSNSSKKKKHEIEL